ncbi:DUF3793 family protein [Clostridium oceanicum]|uniref:DUF3793 family protein n=1 Tax=Clostridium oceanicum TaxID=1543 RepID=A0ABN1JEE2_9CLOT
MSKELLTKYFDTISNHNDKDYLISKIMFSSAPTIANEKVSSLLTFLKDSERNSYEYWEKYKYELKKEFCLEFYELKKDDNRIVVLFYNKDKLVHTLSKENHIKFLKRFGYKEDMNLKEMLNVLRTRYENVCPHEMGIFLGYPLEDVSEFIYRPNKKCLMIGYWKVYHNMEQAKEIFKNYDLAKNKIVNLLAEGVKPYAIINSL